MDILVNKSHPLDKLYIPSNLVTVDNPYYHPSFDDGKLLLTSDTLEAFNKMNNDATYNGIPLFVESGYRSYEYQEKLLNYYLSTLGDEAYNRVAIPGTSEHQTGLCFDAATLIEGIYDTDINEDSLAYKYLLENSYRFGFILRYPKGKEKITMYQFEPWHYRYVGDIAKYIMTNHITLEEYHEEKNSKLIHTI